MRINSVYMHIHVPTYTYTYKHSMYNICIRIDRIYVCDKRHRSMQVLVEKVKNKQETTDAVHRSSGWGHMSCSQMARLHFSKVSILVLIYEFNLISDKIQPGLIFIYFIFFLWKMASWSLCSFGRDQELSRPFYRGRRRAKEQRPEEGGVLIFAPPGGK